MCFFDITGYTRLTQERGRRGRGRPGRAALGGWCSAHRSQHGGRPVKWLGDGVMFYFPEPGPGVIAALDMVRGRAPMPGCRPPTWASMPGRSLFQEGDYFGQTVNIAARIAEYARPRRGPGQQGRGRGFSRRGRATFTEIGPVELKGVSEATPPARRPPQLGRGRLTARGWRGPSASARPLEERVNRLAGDRGCPRPPSTGSTACTLRATSRPASALNSRTVPGLNPRRVRNAFGMVTRPFSDTTAFMSER